MLLFGTLKNIKMEQTKNENVIAKIQKLINLKEGAEAIGNIHEAENAALRIQEFLFKHNLSMEDVENAEIKEKIRMVVTEFDLNPHQAKTEAEWLFKLFGSIANHYLCKAIRTRHGIIKNDQGVMKILGDTNNVAIVIYTVEQLISKIHIAEKMSWKNYLGPEKRNTYKRGFLIGAVQGIDAKLSEQERQMTQENNSMALMVINKKKELEAFTLTKFNNIKYSRASGISSQDGSIHGYAAGYKMNINKGVKSITT